MATYQQWNNNAASSWWRDAGLRKNVFHCAVLCCVIFSLGYDGSLLNGLQALPRWQSFFGRPTGTKLGLINASYFLPKIVIAPILASLVADKYGRKAGITGGCLLMVIGAFIGCFANGLGMYIASRVILGFGTSWGIVIGAPWMSEIAHPRYRPQAQGMFFSSYYFGSITSSWLCFGMVRRPALNNWTWRLPNLVQMIGPMLVLLAIYWMPESPRWLVKQGQNDKALAILAREHADGKEQDELVMQQYQEMVQGHERDQDHKNVGWSALVRGAANRRRLVVCILIGCCTQLNGVGIISYYLAPALRLVGITDPTQIAGINGGLAVWNLVMASVGALISERFGRRTLFLVSLAGMTAMYAVLTAVSAEFAKSRRASVGVGVPVAMYLFYGFYSLAFTPLPTVYVPEIWPTRLRVKAMGVFSTAQSISLAFNVFVNPIILQAITWKAYVIYLAMLVFFSVAHFFLVIETKGHTIEETSLLYDFQKTPFSKAPHPSEMNDTDKSETSVREHVRDLKEA